MTALRNTRRLAITSSRDPGRVWRRSSRASRKSEWSVNWRGVESCPDVIEQLFNCVQISEAPIEKLDTVRVSPSQQP